MRKLPLGSVSSAAWGHVISFPALLVSLILLLFSLPAVVAQTTYTDITGVWTGNLSGGEFNCSPSSEDGPFSGTAVATFSNQVESSFSVDFTSVDDQDGEITNLTGSGYFMGPNQIVFGLIDNNIPGETTTVSFTADINGTLMSFNFNGDTTGGSNCMLSGSGSMTQSGGNQSMLNTAIEAGTTVTSVALLNTGINNFNTSLGTHISGSLRNAPQGLAMNTNGLGYEYKTGLNAGGDGVPYGLWGNYTYTDFENDLSSTAFDGKSHNLLGGIDFAPIKNSVLGISLGYSFTDVDTTFNRGNQENDTYTIAPYFGLLLNDTWSLDASIGFSRINTDQYRIAPGGTNQITSSPSADRWFGSINLNGVTYYNNWIFGGRIGTLRAKNTMDSFVESNGTVVPKITNTLGTISIGADAAYSYGNYEPFASLTYEYDYRFTRIAVVSGPQPANDSDDFMLGLGVRYFGPSGLSGNLEWNRRLGRTNFDEDVFSFSLRAEF